MDAISRSQTIARASFCTSSNTAEPSDDSQTDIKTMLDSYEKDAPQGGGEERDTVRKVVEDCWSRKAHLLPLGDLKFTQAPPLSALVSVTELDLSHTGVLTVDGGQLPPELINLDLSRNAELGILQGAPPGSLTTLELTDCNPTSISIGWMSAIAALAPLHFLKLKQSLYNWDTVKYDQHLKRIDGATKQVLFEIIELSLLAPHQRAQHSAIDLSQFHPAFLGKSRPGGSTPAPENTEQ